ncbi:MAG: ribonuclease III domain-containing protein [Christensenellales bacterium]
MLCLCYNQLMDKYGVSLRILDENKIRELSPLLLAYIGDTVFDLYVRAYLVKNKMGRVNRLHKLSCTVVSAPAQAQAARLLLPMLTEREKEIFRLGRNAKSAPPKNACPKDYSMATAIEAVIGYLYLTGDTGRTDELFSVLLTYFFKGC